MQNFTAVFEKAAEGAYIGWVLEWPEAISQGESLHEAKEKLVEALKLLIKANKKQMEKDLLTRQVMYDIIPIESL